MSKTLTQLISAVQAQLLDDGTRFSTATCTAAIRAILSKMNHRIPLQSAETFACDSDQYEYAISGALYITDVLLWDADGQEDSPLEYQEYQEAGDAYIRLKSPQAAGEYLLVRYAAPHTISGLDSATNSTLSADLDQVLTDGACAEAMQMRAASRVETINMQTEVTSVYLQALQSFRAAYESGVSFYERRQAPPSPGRVTSWRI